MKQMLVVFHMFVILVSMSLVTGADSDLHEYSCACPRNLFLVCGVDGNTYNNLCLLKCHFVELAYIGSCII